VKPIFSPEDRVIIQLLENLKLVKADYPPKLLAHRRAVFVQQVMELGKIGVDETPHLQDQKVIKLLADLKSNRIEYPANLLAKRRITFIKQVAEWEKAEAAKQLQLQNKDIIRLLESLKPIRAEYPQQLLAQRRSAFVGHILKRGKISWWEMLRSVIQDNLISLTRPQRTTTLSFLASFVLIGFIVIASLGSMIYGNHNRSELAFNEASTQSEAVRLYLPTPTSTSYVGVTTCKTGYIPPMCLARTFDKSQDLTFQGNGLARAAVAKDTLPGDNGIHQAAYVNDGLYGSGASWVSQNAHSWIKIDLGQTAIINMVKFGKDRLGNFNGHNPGQFTIAVALADNIYANGDSTNDNKEYKRVFDSATVGFSGVIPDFETVQASFKPVFARYIKITVTNPGTAIDEVEAFYNSTSQSTSSDKTGQSIQSINSQLVLTNTPINPPSPTSIPNNIPTLMPTNTPLPLPTNTPTLSLTDTPIPSSPTDVPTFMPTDTPMPLPTDIPTLIPTDTPVPLPTDTPIPVPSDTPIPVPVDTLIPTQNP